MPLNERLKELRISSGKTQKEIASLLGMAVNAYQRYELGTREPNVQKLITLANIFNVTLDDLMCRFEK